MDGKIARELVCIVCSQRITFTGGSDRAVTCERCGSKDPRTGRRSARNTVAYSLTALIFYIPANLFPFMTLELYGRRSTSTIWQGVVSLTESGSWALAGIVFLASIAIPLGKLVALFYLSATVGKSKNRRFQTRLYHAIEAIGRWSMLDIFLLAVLVAIMKLGPWTTVVPEIGSLMFAFVVIFTMLASASFDPKLIWEEKNELK